MSDKAAWRSREQQAQADFSHAIQQFRPYLEDLPEGPRALDAMTEALLRFGTCEIRMRRAARLRALDMGEPEAAALVKSALAHHERGLAALPEVRPIAAALAARPPDEQDLARWREASPAILADWHEQLAGLDIGESDARHLARIMRECHDAVGADGLPGLGRHLTAQLDELERVRRSDDRGTREASFPWWKIIAAAAILGMTAYAVWVLIMSGAPWWNFYLVALVACVMMLLVALGC